MCWGRLLLITFVLSSCREIEPVSPGEMFSGYQLNGIVTNSSGIPLEGIEFRMFYEYVNGFSPRDTGRVLVSDTVTAIQVEVFDSEGSRLRSFSVVPSPGYLQRNIWDQKDSTARDVKSGLYGIIVYFNGNFARQYTWVVDGNVSAVTDRDGQFTIPKSCLPIANIVDLYNPQGSYTGTSEIIATIRLSSPGVPGSIFVTLSLNQITRIIITL